MALLVIERILHLRQTCHNHKQWRRAAVTNREAVQDTALLGVVENYRPMENAFNSKQWHTTVVLPPESWRRIQCAACSKRS